MCKVCQEIQYSSSGKGRYYCVVFLPGFNRLSLYFPIIQVTGGGGYTKENVAKCWAVETGVLLDTELPNGISFIHFQLCMYLSSLPSCFWVKQLVA